MIDIRSIPAGQALDGLVDERVFGIDRTASTPRLIFEALRYAHPLNVSYPLDDGSIPYLLCGNIHNVTYDGGPTPIGGYVSGWAWAQRAGKPWQADMERHVAEWRAPARAPYSTDIAAAWLVVEKMKKYWFHFERLGRGRLERLTDAEHELIRYGAVFCLRGQAMAMIFGPSATLAICRAALIARSVP